MGFWSNLFGDRDRRPDGERAGEMRDGKKHGVWIERDGKFLCERTYVAGVLHGPAREWHPDGHLFEEMSYAAGKRDGVMRRFHPGGEIAMEATYIGGRLHGMARGFAATGAPTFVREYRDDAMWHGEYEIEGMAKGRYEHGAKTGPWVQWTHDKKVKERGTYVDGKRHGAFELRDTDGDSWSGSFDMDERVGPWEVRRARSGVVAAGEYPRGMLVPWIATRGERRLTFEVATRADLDRWIVLVERWFDDRVASDFKGWPGAERARAIEWIEAQLATKPLPEETDDALPFEAAGRDVLLHAKGDISGLAHPDVPDIESDYMEHWFPPREGTMVDIGTVELPRRMIVDSPETHDARRVFPFRPGTYEVVGLDIGHRLYLPVVIVRLPGSTLARWRYLGEAHDSAYAMFAPSLEIETMDWPPHPEHVNGPPEWIRIADGPSVRITNPAGNGIRAYAGVAEDGDFVALFLQLY